MSDQTPIATSAAVRALSDADYADLWALDEEMRAEREPDDPPVSLEYFVTRLGAMPSFFDVQSMMLREVAGGPLIAQASAGFDESGDNAHICQVTINVLPAQRRRGLGRRLLAWAAGLARERGRRLLILDSCDRVPAGDSFMRRAGAAHGLEDRVSQLDLAALDRDLLARWRADAAPGFELLFWDSAYPEEHIDAFADLYKVMNTAPRGALEIEDQTMSAEKLRDFVASRLARGNFWWTLVARELSSGRLAGFTELVGSPSRPTILSQGATAVRPEYRGRRLGRWLKADMLDRALAGLPAARFVRTGNASDNAPMLAINNDLGFRPYMRSTVWQLGADAALAYAGEP